MKNLLLQIVLLCILTASHVRVSAQEVIARWEGSKELPTIIYASGGNSFNRKKASLERINDGNKLIIVSSSNKKLYSTRWDEGDERFWLVTFSTLECSNISISFSQYSSKKGPQRFKIQYKTETSGWIDLEKSISIPKDSEWTKERTIVLPPSLGNRPIVELRWLVIGNSSFNSNPISDSGTSYLDLNILADQTPQPRTTTWSPQNNSTDWNDSKNWSNGIPGQTSNIIIYSGSSTYPVLTKEDQATCDTVFFKTNIPDQSGEMVNTHLLTYKAAVVELLASSNQYHLIAPPLADMYSGDFFTNISFIGKDNKRNTPGVWMKLYQTDNPEKAKPAVSTYWSGYFNTLDYPLAPGSGLCIWIDNDEVPQEHRTPENMTMVFPKDSVTYAYYNASGQAIATSGELSRLRSHRFAYEAADDYDPANGCFSLPVTSDQGNGEIFHSAIVGNPFMCHLDFLQFQEANHDKIEAEYRIWGGDTFDKSILYGQGDYAFEQGENRYIAPMQAFVVTKKEAYREQALGSLRFSPDMCTVRPGIGLRSASLLDVSSSYPDIKEEDIGIQVGQGKVQIQNNTGHPIAAVYCYNLQGQRLWAKNNLSPGTSTIDLQGTASFVVLKIIINESVVSRKIRL